MSIKAFRFQLRTRAAVESWLRRYAGMGRRVWNMALAEQRARYARGEKYAGHAEMCKWLTAWRHDPATAWLADGPIHPQQQVLRRLDEAYRRFSPRRRQARPAAAAVPGRQSSSATAKSPGSASPTLSSSILTRTTAASSCPSSDGFASG